MKSIFISLIAVTIITVTSAFGGEGGSGKETGGGQISMQHGRPRLLDLVGQTECRWIPANEFTKQITYLPKALGALAKTHWYLANLMEREASKLTICQTYGELPKLQNDDDNDLTIYVYKIDQVAIRVGNRIYLEMNTFKKMPERDRAYLMMHEILHSFVLYDTPMRNMKIRSIVRLFSDNEREPISKEDFAYQLKMNDLTGVIFDTTPINFYSTEIITALNENASSKEKYVAAQKISPLHLEYLTKDDRLTILQLQNAVREKYYDAVAALNYEKVVTAIEMGADPNMLGFTNENVSALSYLADLYHFKDNKSALRLLQYLLSLPETRVNPTLARIISRYHFNNELFVLMMSHHSFDPNTSDKPSEEITLFGKTIVNAAQRAFHKLRLHPKTELNQKIASERDSTPLVVAAKRLSETIYESRMNSELPNLEEIFRTLITDPKVELNAKSMFSRTALSHFLNPGTYMEFVMFFLKNPQFKTENILEFKSHCRPGQEKYEVTYPPTKGIHLQANDVAYAIVYNRKEIIDELNKRGIDLAKTIVFKSNCMTSQCSPLDDFELNGLEFINFVNSGKGERYGFRASQVSNLVEPAPREKAPENSVPPKSDQDLPEYDYGQRRAS